MVLTKPNDIDYSVVKTNLCRWCCWMPFAQWHGDTTHRKRGKKQKLYQGSNSLISQILVGSSNSSQWHLTWILETSVFVWCMHVTTNEQQKYLIFRSPGLLSLRPQDPCPLNHAFTYLRRSSSKGQTFFFSFSNISSYRSKILTLDFYNLHLVFYAICFLCLKINVHLTS